MSIESAPYCGSILLIFLVRCEAVSVKCINLLLKSNSDSNSLSKTVHGICDIFEYASGSGNGSPPFSIRKNAESHIFVFGVPESKSQIHFTPSGQDLLWIKMSPNR